MDLTKALEKLDNMQNLNQGWNGYDALPPSLQVIQRAKDFIQVCPIEPFRVAPSCAYGRHMGAVGITYRKHDNKAYVEFYDNGNAAYMLCLEKNVTASNFSAFDEIIPKIQGFLS